MRTCLPWPHPRNHPHSKPSVNGHWLWGTGAIRESPLRQKELPGGGGPGLRSRPGGHDRICPNQSCDVRRGGQMASSLTGLFGQGSHRTTVSALPFNIRIASSFENR